MNNSRLNPEIIKYKEIDSTNNEAVRLLNKKKSFPYWIVAEKQTDGKGRKNRYWDSLVGNFMGTYVLEIDLERKFLPHLAFVSALAIHDTIEKFILDVDGQILQLKWPNDLILNKFKCGGILIENISSKRVFFPSNSIGKVVWLLTHLYLSSFSDGCGRIIIESID